MPLFALRGEPPKDGASRSGIIYLQPHGKLIPNIPGKVKTRLGVRVDIMERMEIGR